MTAPSIDQTDDRGKLRTAFGRQNPDDPYWSVIAVLVVVFAVVLGVASLVLPFTLAIFLAGVAAIAAGGPVQRNIAARRGPRAG